ncbi:MAG: serine hydrolase domain-containing protein [Candidatus Limnocylindrales bacterium]
MSRGLRIGLVVSLALAFILSPGATMASHGRAPLGTDDALAAQLQSIVDRGRTGRPMVGLGAVVTLADGSRWESGSGFTTSEATTQFSADTPTVIGSITKTFVAALILQLVEEGRLGLDDPLSRWFPSYRFASQVTVRHLLSHTSGIKDYFLHSSYDSLVYGRPTYHWTTDEILTLVRPRLNFAPGTSWSYSNSNYVFLGLIAQRVIGKPLAAVLRGRFWKPLGMSRTYFQGTDALPTDAAQGYLRRRDTWAGLADDSSYRPNTSTATVAWGAGNVLSSAADIATWTRALYGGQVLTPESLGLMTTFNAANYGLGTQQMLVDGVAAWGHTGSLRGYTAITWHLPSAGITVTVLTNRGRISPLPLATELTRAVLAALAAPARELRPAA